MGLPQFLQFGFLVIAERIFFLSLNWAYAFTRVQMIHLSEERALAHHL
jgi:hypothetical protein|tara:strand:- start:394 stop:537 length:144 start_codon:yes stop_codon:yes gene_type:complete